jgi:hypothetical protein
MYDTLEVELWAVDMCDIPICRIVPHYLYDGDKRGSIAIMGMALARYEGDVTGPARVVEKYVSV